MKSKRRSAGKIVGVLREAARDLKIGAIKQLPSKGSSERRSCALVNIRRS